MNLAVADIMYATFITPRVVFKLTFNHPDGVAGTVLCKFLTDANVAWVGAVSSIVTLTTIAIERYYSVMYPLGNKGKLTKRKLKVPYVRLTNIYNVYANLISEVRSSIHFPIEIECPYLQFYLGCVLIFTVPPPLWSLYFQGLNTGTKNKVY